jgi:hypothetical protein
MNVSMMDRFGRLVAAAISVISPFNSYNLGWKLAACAKGMTSGSILDTCSLHFSFSFSP